jgi:hypothetical protein
MKLLTFLGACALALNAQITGELNPLRDGSTEIRIRNNATVSLTAFVIRVNDINGVIDGPLVIYADSAVDSTVPPVAPHEERPVEDGRRFVTRKGKETYAVFDQRVVTAGIFADGGTVGDETLLAGLVARRRSTVQALEMALEMLSDAGHHNVPKINSLGSLSGWPILWTAGIFLRSNGQAGVSINRSLGNW